VANANPSVIRQRTGRSFGTAVRPDHLIAGSRPARLIAEHCDFLIPEYHAQWSAVEWRRGNPWFGNLDSIADFARACGKTVRGHALIWEQMTPDWARQAMLRDRDWSVVHAHFATLLARYHDIAPEWIVVNECIDTEQGAGDIRRTSFQRAFGNDYVERALETARDLAPTARLFINDYALEYDNPVDEARRNALLRLVERLRQSGVPLDGVGVQAHLELAKGPLATQALQRFCKQLVGMGVEIAITELDVLEHDRRAPIAVRDARVADATRAFLDVVHAQPCIRTIATWGLFDQDSWLQERDPETRSATQRSPVDCGRLNRGLPFDGDYVGKPMLSVLSA
jgi:endo-1,4-beta-xylanase